MITTSFDPHTPEIISPSALYPPQVGFPRTMVVTFQPNTFAVVLDQYDTEPLADLALEEVLTVDTPMWPGRARALEYHGHLLGVCLSAVGASAAVALAEKAAAMGTTHFVFFGSSGGLVPELATGGLIVPTAAYRDEGTSYHYADASDFIDVASAPRTAEILTEMGVPHTLGKVWTTDAFYRETEANLAARVADGCIAVEMEASALAGFAQFRSVDVHHFLYTADSLSGQQWEIGELGSLPAEPRARYITIALELAVRL